MKTSVLLKTHRLTATTVALALLVGVGTVVLRAQAAERTLFVSVLDDKYAPVTTLNTRDFIVREDAIAREVLRSSRATEPVDIALLVDNSASAQDAVQRIRDAARPFAASLQPANAVAVVGLADRPTVLDDYTTNTTSTNRAIDRIFPQSGSGMRLLDAIVEVSRGLKKREGVRRAIVAVLTEGPEFSNLHYTQVLDALKDGGAAFYPILIGSNAPGLDEPSRNRAQVLDEGARASGGFRQIVLSPMGVDSALRIVAAAVTNQYKVVYARPESLIPPRKIAVAVRQPGLTAYAAPAIEVRQR